MKGLIGTLRGILPDTAFFFEADYSTPMSSALVVGEQDIAVLYSPVLQPDLTFETLGEVTYVMVSRTAECLDDIPRNGYIFGNYSAAFAHAHEALFPDLSEASLSIGQNAAMVDLLTSLEGSGYMFEHSAKALVETGGCRYVADAPKITQPVFVGLNMRNRHRPAYRKMIRALHDHFGPVTTARRRSRR